MKISDIIEAFRDIGKLSQDELQKGQRLDPTSEDNFEQVDGNTYHKAITGIMRNDLARGDAAKGLDTLTVYSRPEYDKMNCFLGKNNSSGYCIKDGDELVSVFSSQGSSGNALMVDAVKNGASRLDCFATRSPNGEISGALYKLYSRHGFKVDTDMNSGTPGEAYSIQNGVSSFVDDAGNVHHDDPRVVIFMKR